MGKFPFRAAKTARLGFLGQARPNVCPNQKFSPAVDEADPTPLFFMRERGKSGIENASRRQLRHAEGTPRQYGSARNVRELLGPSLFKFSHNHSAALFLTSPGFVHLN